MVAAICWGLGRGKQPGCQVPATSVHELMTMDMGGPSGSITGRQGKARKRKGCHKPFVEDFWPPLMFHYGPGRFTAGGRLLKGQQPLRCLPARSTPWGGTHGTTLVHSTTSESSETQLTAAPARAASHRPRGSSTCIQRHSASSWEARLHCFGFTLILTRRAHPP